MSKSAARKTVRKTKAPKAPATPKTRPAMTDAPTVLPDDADCWALAEAAQEHCSRVLLYGLPGVGKTHSAVHNARQGQDVMSCTLTPDTPAAELRGFYVPREGAFAWQDGPAMTAWRAGGRLVLNELSRAGGDLLTLLLAVCDDPEFARLVLPSGETVRPSAGFSVVATMNGEPQDLEEALLDRFPVRIKIDKLHPKAVAALPEDLRRPAAASAVQPDAARRIGYRTWAEFGRLRPKMGERPAARALLAGRADELVNALRIARA